MEWQKLSNFNRKKKERGANRDYFSSSSEAETDETVKRLRAGRSPRTGNLRN